MVRYALPPILMAGPVLAHGVHAPVPPALHGAAHLAVSAGLLALAVAAGVAALRHGRRRKGRNGEARRGGR